MTLTVYKNGKMTTTANVTLADVVAAVGDSNVANSLWRAACIDGFFVMPYKKVNYQLEK